jgi:hypothetical protein
MTHEKFIVAGVARNNQGKLKARYSTLSVAETVARQERAGNTEILYVELPEAMTREDIPAFLLGLEQFSSVPAFKAVLEAANTNHALKSKAPRAKPAATAAAKPAKAPKVMIKEAMEAAGVDADLEIEELKALSNA